MLISGFYLELINMKFVIIFSIVIYDFHTRDMADLIVIDYDDHFRHLETRGKQLDEIVFHHLLDL